jgi:hypothetical protein
VTNGGKEGCDTCGDWVCETHLHPWEADGRCCWVEHLWGRLVDPLLILDDDSERLHLTLMRTKVLAELSAPANERLLTRLTEARPAIKEPAAQACPAPSLLPPPFPLPPRLGTPLLNAVVLPTREPPHRLVNKEEIRWREVVTSALHRARDGTEGAAKSARRIRACGLIKGVDQRDETRFFEAAVRGSRPLLDPPPPSNLLSTSPASPSKKAGAKCLARAKAHAMFASSCALKSPSRADALAASVSKSHGAVYSTLVNAHARFAAACGPNSCERASTRAAILAKSAGAGCAIFA